MSLFFSSMVTSSPIKRRLRSSSAHQSLDVSLLSPDSSYVCYSSPVGSPLAGDVHSICCRRSPRLLTNGYYAVTDDSFLWDEDGNVSLAPCAARVSYKENIFRVFRRRRRKAGRSLAHLLSDVTESCQTWLDSRVFGDVFRTSQDPDQESKDPHSNQNWAQEEGFTSLEEPSWSSCSFFTYDPCEVVPTPDKETPFLKQIIQEDICSEICQSSECFTQSLGGLSEVPPPSVFYASTCRQPNKLQSTGITSLTLFLLLFAVFIFTTLCSCCFLRSAAEVAAMAACTITATCMCASRSTGMRGWRRRAMTEDITSRYE
ncbi:transmembrane protein 71 [Syngnathoides biaculeatus]|uniref:transmembrane protein 71 n=1 Tax=Syngnathoides biaculeatus TaxID=300417 RepID=UPI002ADE4ED0|nr:transmembrane protein 71 [Syngnathoides biaculeatus]XP_061695998.1 transmembrane protein 71 [Syngnathoides biaculeatus]